MIRSKSDTLSALDQPSVVVSAPGLPTPMPTSTPAEPPSLCVRYDLLALDIETNGLDPASNQILAVAFVGSSFERSFLGSDEHAILRQTEAFIRSAPWNTLLVTWNGEEFDLPFLRTRFTKNRLQTSLTLTERSETGKYGGKLFRALWGSTNHLDIAPMFKDLAASLGVPWSLKPVARRVLKIEPVEVNRSGEAIAALSAKELRRYVSSDARVTHLLATRLLGRTGIIPPVR